MTAHRRHLAKPARPAHRPRRWAAVLLAVSGVVTGSLIWGGTLLGVGVDDAGGRVIAEPQSFISAKTLKKIKRSSREISRDVVRAQRPRPDERNACVSNCPDRFAILPGEDLREKPSPAELARRAELRAANAPMSSFVVSSFNILGSQHTTGSHDGFGSGVSRAAGAAGLISSRGASIVGFSELQSDQLGVLDRNLPSFGFFPGTSLGSDGVPTTIGWDTRVWTLEETRTFNIVFSHQSRPQPIIKLTNRASGASVWVVNVHNSPQGMEAERDVAIGIEVGVINQLTATGVPVIVTGDFNEKEEALCRITSGTVLESAVGGSGCTPIRGARIDWIFRSPELSVESYVADRGAPVPSITDHAVMFARLSRS